MGIRSIVHFIRMDSFKTRIATRIGTEAPRIISVFILALAAPLAIAGTNIFGSLLEGIGTVLKEKNPPTAETAGDIAQASQTDPLNLTRDPDNRNLFSAASDGNHNPHVLVIHKGKLYGYGGNQDGELAHGEVTRETSSGSVFYRNPANLTAPSQIDVSNVYKVVTSSGRTFVLLNNGSLMAFGRSTRDELGGDLSGVIPVPRKIDGIEDVVDVRTNGLNGFVIALKSDGSVWYWGPNSNNKAFDFDGMVARSRGSKWKMTTAIPERFDVRPVKKILVRNQNTFAITAEGQLFEIRANKERFINDATDVVDFLNANDDCSGNTCPVYFVDSKGKTYATGPNSGMYGNGATDSGDDYQKATPIPELKNMTSIASYFLTSIGLDKSGDLHVWGSERGCMPYPVEMKGLPKFQAISSAHGSFWGLTKAGDLIGMPLDALCGRGRFTKIAIPGRQ